MEKISIFQKCIKHYCKERHFFDPWFKQYGYSYTFIFKQSLKVTNIQYAELISLIKDNIKFEPDDDKDSIQFLCVSDFNETIENLLSSFSENFSELQEDEDLLKCIEDSYLSLFKHIIVVDAFWNSCVIFLPYNMALNIETVCAQSGYVHSCGNNIYTRRISKAEKNIFYDIIDSYITKNKIKNNTLFVPYSHEDFTPFDRDEGQSFLKNGLDEIKFYAEKFYMGEFSFTDVIHEMESRFKEKLEIPKAGDYHLCIKGKSKSSIFLIVDRRPLNEQSNYPSREVFYICYEQKYINENPYHLFDENKPGWIDHVTIPHTLMGSMLNIAMPIAKKYREKDTDKINILDPFVGSGTTYLESLKYFDINFSGSDLTPLATIVAKDNLLFFRLKYDDLNKIYLRVCHWQSALIGENTSAFSEKEREYINTKINTINVEMSKSATRHFKRGSDSIYTNVIKEFEIIMNNFDENHQDVDSIIKECLDGLKEFDAHLCFYLCLKAYKRNIKGFNRKSVDLYCALFRELEKFGTEITNLIKLRKRIDKIDNDEIKQNGQNVSYLANFSNGCSVDIDKLDVDNVEKTIKSNRDVIEELNESTENKYDIIITDPPYGFNTHEETKEFARLYADMLPKMLNKLKPHGQLLICLPEASNTGRMIHYFTQKRIIMHQLLTYASKNRSIILPLNIISTPKWLYKAPYFWESEKVLRRSILHFVITPKCDKT